MTTSLALGTKVTAITSTGSSVEGTISAIIALPSGDFDYNVDYSWIYGIKRTLSNVPSFLVTRTTGRHAGGYNAETDRPYTLYSGPAKHVTDAVAYSWQDRTEADLATPFHTTPRAY